MVFAEESGTPDDPPQKPDAVLETPGVVEELCLPWVVRAGRRCVVLNDFDTNLPSVSSEFQLL